MPAPVHLSGRMLVLKFDPAGKVSFGEVLSQRPSMTSQPTDLRTSTCKEGNIREFTASLSQAGIKGGNLGRGITTADPTIPPWLIKPTQTERGSTYFDTRFGIQGEEVETRPFTARIFTQRGGVFLFQRGNFS